MAPHLTGLLERGLDVVLDFPANTPASRRWVRGIAQEAGAPAVLHFLDTPDARCLVQLARRNRELPEGSMPMSPEDFASITALFVPPDPGEGFTIRMV